MDNEAQFVRDYRSTFSRLTDEDKKEQVRNVLIGIVAGFGVAMFLYLAFLAMNAIDNAHASYLAHQMLIQSETNYNASTPTQRTI